MMHTVMLLIYLTLILMVIFFERKRPTEALLWVLVLICLPYAGAVLYLIFGSTTAIRLTAFIRKRRLLKRDLRRTVHPLPPCPKDRPSEEDTKVMHFNAVYNGSDVTSYSDAKFFTDGESHYRALFSDIRGAKECIFIEFYTIHHDMMGEALVKALADKAREGVTVLVMCDFLANVSTPRKMFRPLIEAGGQVIRLKPYLTHYRSHRKIVVIDHKIGYIGGMNIGKQYANLAEKKNPWRDTQVRLTGSCTEILDEYFASDWLCGIRRKDFDREADRMAALPEETGKQTENLCQFVVGGVDTSKESVKMCYLSMIQSAKRRIRIQTPYFIPDESILDALKTAAASGVEIELMIPGIKASFFLDPVTTYYAGELMKYGAKVYKYHGYIHAKTMTVDDEICCIGSVNMDMRSLMVDDEICGVFYPNTLVREYSDIFTADIENCTEYTKKEFDERSRGERLMEGFFLLFAPLM